MSLFHFASRIFFHNMLAIMEKRNIVNLWLLKLHSTTSPTVKEKRKSFIRRPRFQHSDILGWIPLLARFSVRMKVHTETQGIALNPQMPLCCLPRGQEVTAQRTLKIMRTALPSSGAGRHTYIKAVKSADLSGSERFLMTWISMGSPLWVQREPDRRRRCVGKSVLKGEWTTEVHTSDMFEFSWLRGRKLHGRRSNRWGQTVFGFKPRLFNVMSRSRIHFPTWRIWNEFVMDFKHTG